MSLFAAPAPTPPRGGRPISRNRQDVCKQFRGTRPLALIESARPGCYHPSRRLRRLDSPDRSRPSSLPLALSRVSCPSSLVSSPRPRSKVSRCGIFVARATDNCSCPVPVPRPVPEAYPQPRVSAFVALDLTNQTLSPHLETSASGQRLSPSQRSKYSQPAAYGCCASAGFFAELGTQKTNHDVDCKLGPHFHVLCMISACCGGFPPMNATCDEECASRPSLPAFVAHPTPLARAKSGQAMEAHRGVPHAQRPPPIAHRPPAPGAFREQRAAGLPLSAPGVSWIYHTAWTTLTARRPLDSHAQLQLPTHPSSTFQPALGRLAFHHGHHR